ncbi:MAG: hypothetical protein JXA30_07460 [Deltaproteobacteria bacterium]|nr:hypothetical protein [Deltaproteobacteria bacterium]
MITWDSQQPTVRSDALRATIWNVSERPIKANLKVVAYGPTGDTITRKLGSRALNGGSSQLVHVPIGDLPIQSAGASTAVILVASYPGDSLYSTKGNAQESGTVEAFSVYKHVTFDEDFSIATIRTIEAQVEANQPIYEGESKPGPIAMRVYDESTDTINKAASAVSPNFENKGEPAAVVSILKLDPSAYGPRSITDLRFQTKEE